MAKKEGLSKQKCFQACMNFQGSKLQNWNWSSHWIEYHHIICSCQSHSIIQSFAWESPWCGWRKNHVTEHSRAALKATSFFSRKILEAFFFKQEVSHSLLETDSSPLKIGFSKSKVVFQPSIFRGENLSFMECSLQEVIPIETSWFKSSGFFILSPAVSMHLFFWRLKND